MKSKTTTKRTDKQINEQIAGLKAIAKKRTFRRYTSFGDDNKEAIEAQIEVLEERLNEDAVYDREDNGDLSQHAASAARDVAQWLAGDNEDLPAEGWDGLH